MSKLLELLVAHNVNVANSLHSETRPAGTLGISCSASRCWPNARLAAIVTLAPAHVPTMADERVTVAPVVKKPTQISEAHEAGFSLLQ